MQIRQIKGPKILILKPCTNGYYSKNKTCWHWCTHARFQILAKSDNFWQSYGPLKFPLFFSGRKYTKSLYQNIFMWNFLVCRNGYYSKQKTGWWWCIHARKHIWGKSDTFWQSYGPLNFSLFFSSHKYTTVRLNTSAPGKQSAMSSFNCFGLVRVQSKYFD